MKKTHARKPIRHQHRPTISLCVIARDEEEFIGDCLASAAAFVDEIVVLDTGSTDATPEIARRHGARVATFAWQDDFSAARNAAIDLATSDWILMLDADERLQPASGPALRAFVASNPSGPTCYAPRIESLEGNGPQDFKVSFHNRLFQPRAGLRYVGAIHEDLAYLPDPAGAWQMRLDLIRITHLGYLPEVIVARDKYARNRRMLLNETVARPEDPLAWFYLGMHELMAKRPDEASEHLRRSLACSANRPTWSRVDAYTNLVRAYVLLNDAERLHATVEEAEHAGALSAAARSILAQDLVAHGLYAEAERQLLAALEPDQPVLQVATPGVGGWITRMDLARIYEHTGNPQAALEQVELSLADPELRERGEAASTAVRLAVELGDMASLARCLESLTPPGVADLEGHMRRLELLAMAGPPAVASASAGRKDGPSPIDRAIALGDWQSAYDIGLTLSGRTMAEAARLLFVAIRLQDGGAPEAALNLLGRLHDAQPGLPQLHALLTTVLADLGRYDDALAANAILQELLSAQQSLAA